MKPQEMNVQEAIELLIQRFETEYFDFHFKNGNQNMDKRELAVGNITIKYSAQGSARSSRHYQFSALYNDETVYQGIMGYLPLLYTKQNKKLREYLLEQGSISGILTINHCRYSYSQTAFVLFGNGDSPVWLASCEEEKDAAQFLRDKNCENVSVYYTDALSSENFLPEHYSKDEKEIAQVFSEIDTKPLEELAEVIAGKGARSSDYCDQGIPYLRARDIQKGRLILPDVCLPIELARDFSRQLLQEGDILLTKNFGQRKIALVTEDDLPAIASNAMYIIRPYGVSEQYLYRYLVSRTGNAVFNAQLKRIEEGSVVASIPLTDLKRIQVPFYDEETMIRLEQIDTLNEDENLETALRIISYTGGLSGIDLEQAVYEELNSAGWETTRFSLGASVSSGKWTPDLLYTLEDGTKVYFEVKSLSNKVTPEWISFITETLNGPNKSYYVLTTGYYYEVHVSGIANSLRVLHAPTIEEIREWERRQR